jgi:hypothetical protein
MSQTPMAFLKDSNLLPSRGLVRMSVNWLSVGMNLLETDGVVETASRLYPYSYCINIS